MTRAHAAKYELYGLQNGSQEFLQEFKIVQTSDFRKEAGKVARNIVLAKRFTNFDGFRVVEKRIVSEFSLEDIRRERAKEAKEVRHEQQ